MNQIKTLIQQLCTTPENVQFQDVISVIDENYHYTPTQFSNGLQEEKITNASGENEGSCKIFSFAKINDLNETQTLHCFGEYYRSDVLKNPDNSDHGNIRTFIKYGWSGIIFESTVLELKK